MKNGPHIRGAKKNLRDSPVAPCINQKEKEPRLFRISKIFDQFPCFIAILFTVAEKKKNFRQYPYQFYSLTITKISFL